MGWLDVITDAIDMSLSKPQEMVKDREAWHAAVHGSRLMLSDWTTVYSLDCFEDCIGQHIYVLEQCLTHAKVFKKY